MINGIHTNNKQIKSELKTTTSGTPLKIDSQKISIQEVNSNIKAAVDRKLKQSLLQRFYNLSISHKQMIALLASELLSIVGISVVGRILITTNLQSLSLEQAKSEVAVTDITYNIKVNQMGFGFRGQSDNPAIIKAAIAHASGSSVNTGLKDEIKQILANELKARKIEYATLVGKDLKIIVNANANREGEIFDPNNLVSEVFKNGQQIKASRIVSWSELSKEAPTLPEGFKNQDALIRYTVTPVKDPNTQAVVGALVSGDIVNGKDPIVKGTLKATGGGYSAVYLRQPNGEFSLVTSLDKAKSQDINQSKANVKLPKEAKYLLEEAAASEGKAVTGRMKVGEQTYTIAAKAVPNKIIETEDAPIIIHDERPVAILVRGTPENALNQLLENSFWVEVVTVILAFTIIAIWAMILRRSIITPIQNLQQTTQQFATGDRTARSEIFATDEIGQLALTFNTMADNITEQVRRQENEVKITQIVNSITAQFRSSLNNGQILNLAVSNTREAIKADRVIVYRFDKNWYGKVIAESVGADWPVSLGAEIADSCFAKEYVHKYQRGAVLATNNIYTANLTECHLNLLQEFAVQANLVAPILIHNNLYGLLIAHQCSGPRQWQELEINLLQRVAIPIGYAIEQSLLLEEVDKARSRAELAAIEERQQNEAIQEQLLYLLRDIEGACQGDLTVRSEVTFGELGTVADFFNSIVESLREIVTKVKVSAVQVNTAINDNEVAISQLAAKALKQADDINLTLASVDNMTVSIQALATDAEKAAEFAHKASQTAQESGTVMDLTVQNILQLRSTISDTAKKVKRLGESSQQISHIISLISQIAMQTHLLAINAGLEAERAGVKGEGFAIIAEEIDELAARCSDATQEIGEIVEKIQLETSEVIKAMEEGTTQVVEGSTIVKEAKIALNHIIQVSSQMDELVQSISQVTASQVQTSQVVSKLMKDISQVSEFTSASSLQVAESLQQTVEISQELQETVETFKVD